MNHRLLRRKIMKEMWENTDSMKSDEQGMSWLLRLKEDIRRLLEDGTSLPTSRSRAGCHADHGGEDRIEQFEWCPSNGLKPAPGQEPPQPTSGLPKSQGYLPSTSPLLLGLKRVSVHLVDCRKMLGQSDHIIHKTTHSDKHPCGSSIAEKHNKTVSEMRPESHICDHCGKDFVTAINLHVHVQYLKRSSDSVTAGKPHVCIQCGKGFSQAGSLKIHWRTHTGEKPYVCQQCGKGFTESGPLKRHIRSHTGEKPFHCHLCGKDFIESGGLKKHTKRAHPGEEAMMVPQRSIPRGENLSYHCSKDDCRMSFATSRERRVHQRKHIQEKLLSMPNTKQHKETLSADSSHICDHCGKNFTARNLKRHLQYLQRSQNVKKSHVCTECGKGFPLPGSLKRHLRTHTGEKPYICHHCGKDYNDSGNLKRHIKTHIGEKPYHCSDCGKKFRVKISLEHHREVVHTEHPHRCGQCKKTFITVARLESHIKIRHPPNDPLKNPHVCSECGRGFPIAARLKLHMRIHTGEKPYVCPRCGKDFTQSGLLQRHMRTHTGEKPYHCSVCGMKFRCTKTLQRHHQENHKGETLGPIRMHQEPLPCPHCEEKFPTKALLKDHLQKTHNSRVHCPQCDKTFSTKANLLVHQRKHTGERPYLCPQCGKSFSLTGSLKLHLRIHAGEKPYHCTYCDKKFTSKSHCNLHLRIHTGEKPYQCSDCGRRFRDGNVLNNHKRTHTGEKPFQCHECNKAFAQLSSLKKHQETHRSSQPVSVRNPYLPHNQPLPYPYLSHNKPLPQPYPPQTSCYRVGPMGLVLGVCQCCQSPCLRMKALPHSVHCWVSLRRGS
ncbi:zinc finger protein 2 isoform X2 [Esox lucius]|nr:zinc finger protein 2 isoform X2 [Esox lucius]